MRVSFVAMVLCLGFFAVGCGGSSEPAASQVPASTVPATAAVTPAAAPAAVTFPATADRADAADQRLHGSFVLGGADANLAHVRARALELKDNSNAPGYEVLLSERPVKGDYSSFRGADPTEVGNFMYVLLEGNGTVFIAEMGHTGSSAASHRFGILMELKTPQFAVTGDRLSAQIRTEREQEFNERYSVDVAFEAPLEAK